VGVATWLAIVVSRPAGGVSIVWVGSGLLAGILLTSPYRAWIPYLVAALAGNLLARSLCGDALPIVIGRGIASTLDAGVVAWALRHFVGDVSDPARLLRVVGVAVTSTLLGGAASALIAAATSAAVGHAEFAPTFSAWFASHVLGMVIFATLTVVLRKLTTKEFSQLGGHWKFARSMGLVAATTLGVFAQQRYPLLFLVYPPLLLGVFRHRFIGFAIGLAIVVVISIAATTSGSGPWPSSPGRHCRNAPAAAAVPGRDLRGCAAGGRGSGRAKPPGRQVARQRTKLPHARGALTRPRRAHARRRTAAVHLAGGH
jgi:integral membrane sensor domain MASE1